MIFEPILCFDLMALDQYEANCYFVPQIPELAAWSADVRVFVAVVLEPGSQLLFLLGGVFHLIRPWRVSLYRVPVE